MWRERVWDQGQHGLRHDQVCAGCHANADTAAMPTARTLITVLADNFDNVTPQLCCRWTATMESVGMEFSGKLQIQDCRLRLLIHPKRSVGQQSVLSVTVSGLATFFIFKRTGRS